MKGRWGRVAGLVAVAAIVAAGCGGGTGGVDPSLPGGGDDPEVGVTVDTKAPAEGTVTLSTLAAEGSASPGSNQDLCDLAPKPRSYLVEIGLLDEDDLADLPVPYEFQTEGYWHVEPLGPDGAATVADGLVGDVWLCDLEPSPAVSAALEALFEEKGDDVTIEEIRDTVDEASGGEGGESGSSGEAGMSDLETQQLIRDMLRSIAIAQRLGLHLGSEEMWDEVHDLVDDYYGVKVFETEDPGELMTIIAALELLGGHEELAEIARDRVEEILLDDLAAAESLFTPCTQDPQIIEAYFRALSRAHLFLGVDTGLASEWIEYQERMAEQVARGEDPSIPECEGAVWESSTPLPSYGDGPKWDGTVDIHLETCGYRVWRGKMTVDGVLNTGDGTMTQHAEVPLSFSVDPYRSEYTDVLDTQAVRIQDFFTLVAGDARGEGLADMDALAELIFYDGEYSVKVTFNPADFQLVIMAGGMKVSRTQRIDWGARTFRGDLVRLDALCGPKE